MQQIFWYIITGIGLAQVAIHYTLSPSFTFEVIGCIFLNSLALLWSHFNGFMKHSYFRLLFGLILLLQPVLSFYYLRMPTPTNTWQYGVALVAIVTGVVWLVHTPLKKREAFTVFHFILYTSFLAFTIHHLFSIIFTIIACNTWMTIAVDQRLQELKKNRPT